MERLSKYLLKWCDGNIMNSNPDKCQLSRKNKNGIVDFKIENGTCGTLLGVQFDNRLIFDYHISELCKNANKKINAPARVSQYMNLSKRKILMDGFFN